MEREIAAIKQARTGCTTLSPYYTHTEQGVAHCKQAEGNQVWKKIHSVAKVVGRTQQNGCLLKHNVLLFHLPVAVITKQFDIRSIHVGVLVVHVVLV